MINHNLQI